MKRPDLRNTFAPWIDDPDDLPEEDWSDDDIEEMGLRLERAFGNRSVRDGLVAVRDASWREDLHPRGQPENKGQFGPGGGGATKTKARAGVRKAKGAPKRSAYSEPEATAAEALAASRARATGKKAGADGHPGEGYSPEAKVINGVIHTSSPEDAAKALGEHRKVELDQPRGVSVVLERLGAVAARMIERGEKAPTINLCNLSVKGSNLFCIGHQGLTRDLMPQMDEAQTVKFLEHLKSKGYKVREEEQYASHLRATQNELNGVKVAGIANKMRSGDYVPPRTVVSGDDYILDGHHRWAAKVGNDSQDNILTNDTKYPISRVNISITKLLEEAEVFTGGKGKVGVGEGTETAQGAREPAKDLPLTGELKPVKTVREKMAEGRARHAAAQEARRAKAEGPPRVTKMPAGEGRQVADWDTYPDAAGSDVFAPEYIKSLQATADEMAAKHGFPKENLAIKVGIPRTTGGMAAGVYDFATQQIGIFPMVGEPSPQSIRALLAHEMTHHSHNTVMTDWRSEAAKMNGTERTAYESEQSLDELAKKYPTAVAMRPYAMDKVMEKQNVKDAKRVSPYAAEFWGADKKDSMLMTLATSETLASISEEREAWGGEGYPPRISEFWRGHHETVERLHKGRKA